MPPAMSPEHRRATMEAHDRLPSALRMLVCEYGTADVITAVNMTETTTDVERLEKFLKRARRAAQEELERDCATTRH